ncbi:MAG: 1-aminocyclopropane-1-carboxylate deaminase [Kiloniellales bacterium]
MALIDFPREPLTFGPSPLHPLPQLSAALGGQVEIWAKRDDCNSGLAYGGNKTRKLEYLIPDARAQGCDTLVSIGGIQSNHTRQVAAVAAKTGFRCHLIQGTWVPWDAPLYHEVGNILLSRIMDAETAISEEPFGIGIKESWEAALAALREQGAKPYAIPAGASDHPLGGLGYAGFAEELLAQERDLGFAFDTLITASGSGSTQAGMVAGMAKVGRARDVLGIDITARPEQTRAAVMKIAQQTAEQIDLGRPLEEDEVVLDESYAAPAYGIPAAETLEAIRLAARLEGVLTDPVYEGKSMQALIDKVRAGVFPSGTRLLYVHLGGAPALDAYWSAFSQTGGEP